MSDFKTDEDNAIRPLDFNAWKKLGVYALPQRFALGGMIGAGLILAGTESIMPMLTGWIVDDALAGNGDALWWNALVYFVLILINSLLVLFFIRSAGLAATGIANNIRQAAFAQLQKLSYSFFDQSPVGWLMARLTSDTSKLAQIIPWFLLDMVWGFAFIVAISTMMLWINWQLALLVMMTIPVLFQVTRVFQRKLLQSQRDVRRVNSQITASYNENIMGVRTSKALVREQDNLREFQQLSGELYQHSVRNRLQASIYHPLMISISSFGIAITLWYGGVDTQGVLSLGELVAFMQYAALFYVPIQEMSETFTQFQSAQASAERVQGLLATEPEISDQSEGFDTLEPLPQKIERIEFRDVEFYYEPENPVLRRFNLHMQRGDTVALVGATGSGKSTIVNLVARFYQPKNGAIVVNGVDYRRFPLQDFQSRFGIVSQTPQLFSGTIMENIRYGRLDAGDDEVYAVAEQVNASEFILALEDGFATRIGEGGSRLSTGQKQLIALARAMIADPDVFILDEATSSIDTETERLIQHAVEQVMQGRISFVVAHRLSTIRCASTILVIDRGVIVEQGNHGELLAARGRYFQLYQNQFNNELEAKVFNEMDARA
jgi:ATP-binding cassette subfamily B protein